MQLLKYNYALPRNRKINTLQWYLRRIDTDTDDVNDREIKSMVAPFL